MCALAILPDLSGSAPTGKPRLLLTGATGLLGTTVVDRWTERWSIIALTRHWRILRPGVVNLACDLEDPASLADLVVAAKPDVVLHAAAWTDVDGCEANPVRARIIHRDASEALARGAQRARARMIYVSTDAVYSQSGGPHSENAPVSPLSVYAKTKYEGECAVISACPDALVIRTCIVGWNAQPKRSLVEWLLGDLRAGRSIHAFSDVSFTPITSNTLARTIEHLVTAGARGIVHAGGAECISKFDYAIRLAEVFELPRELILQASVSSAKLAAPRPSSPCLDSTRCARLTGIPAETVSAGLFELKRLDMVAWPTTMQSLISRSP